MNNIYITLINFHEIGISENWLLTNFIPNEGDIISIGDTKAIVSYKEFHFSGNSCNIFIHTKKIIK